MIAIPVGVVILYLTVTTTMNQRRIRKLMADLSALRAAVEAQTAVTQSAISLLEDVSTLVDTDQAELAALVDQLNAQKDALAAAVAATRGRQLPTA